VLVGVDWAERHLGRRARHRHPTRPPPPSAPGPARATPTPAAATAHHIGRYRRPDRLREPVRRLLDSKLEVLVDDFEWIDVQAKPGGMERGMDPACLRNLLSLPSGPH
jgi:hypothetical protein